MSLASPVDDGRSAGGASVRASRPWSKSFPLRRLVGSLAPPKNSPTSPLWLFASPNQVENFSFERPVFDALAEMFAHRILLHVEPFLGVVLAVAQAMMPAT